MLWKVLEQHMRELSVENYKFPALDQTTPWFEFLSYQESCWSLDRPVRLGSFMRYQAYLREIGIVK